MDEYINDYIDNLINNPDIEREELEETLRLYINDEEIIEELVKVHKENQKSPTVCISLHPKIEEDNPPAKVKNPCFFDPEIKKAIVRKFDLEKQREPSPNLLLPRYLVDEGRGKKKTRMIRYINDQIVTTTGQKYVEEKEK